MNVLKEKQSTETKIGPLDSLAMAFIAPAIYFGAMHFLTGSSDLTNLSLTLMALSCVMIAACISLSYFYSKR